MKKIYFLIILTGSLRTASAQQNSLDSLLASLDQLNTLDTTYVNLANEIAGRYIFVEPRQTMYYAKIAHDLALELDYEKGVIRSLINIGNSYIDAGLPDQALSYYLQALTSNPEQYPYEYVRLHNNIGEVYRRQEMFDSSYKYFRKALSLVGPMLRGQKPVIIYSNLGEVSLMQNKIGPARNYFRMCLKNASEANNLIGMGYGYYGLAECHAKQDRYDSAIFYQRKSINVRMAASHQRGLTQSFLCVGDYYANAASDSSTFYWNKAVAIAKQSEAYELLNQAYERLYNYYLAENNIFYAAQYLQKNQGLTDSLLKVEYLNKVEQIEAALQAELLSSENQSLKKQQEELIFNTRTRLILIVLIALLIMGLMLYYFINTRRKQEISVVKSDKGFTEVLLTLSSQLNNSEFKFASFISLLLKTSRAVLECDRATYWQYNPEQNEMELKSINEDTYSNEIPILTLKMSDYRFLEELFERSSAVEDLSKNEKFEKLYNDYFKPAKIKSLLNSFITIDGNLHGFISFSMKNDVVRKWNNREELFVSSLNDLINIAISKSRTMKLEQEKEVLIKKLQIKNKSLQEFNNVVSHNLREPLTQIIGFSSLLSSKNQINNSQELAEHVSVAANRIDTVVKELSTVLNEDDPEVSDFQVVSLENVIMEVNELFRAELNQRQVELALDFSVNEIHTYKPFLVDILYHLLSNSLKFSDAEQTLVISIKSNRSGEAGVELNFSDNGYGIDLKKFGDKAFKMYQRYHLNVDGRGVGLFIVKNRIISLGGTISWESAEGQGSTFSITLPTHLNELQMTID